MKYTYVDWVAYILVLVGALNWGLVGAFDYNLVDSIFGVDSAGSSVIYILVALAGVYTFMSLSRHTMNSAHTYNN